MKTLYFIVFFLLSTFYFYILCAWNIIFCKSFPKNLSADYMVYISTFMLTPLSSVLKNIKLHYIHIYTFKHTCIYNNTNIDKVYLTKVVFSRTSSDYKNTFLHNHRYILRQKVGVLSWYKHWAFCNDALMIVYNFLMKLECTWVCIFLILDLIKKVQIAGGITP